MKIGSTTWILKWAGINAMDSQWFYSTNEILNARNRWMDYSIFWDSRSLLLIDNMPHKTTNMMTIMHSCWIIASCHQGTIAPLSDTTWPQCDVWVWVVDSNIAISAVLGQVNVNEWCVTQYASSVLNSAQWNYAMIEHKALSIVKLTELFHPYLFNKNFICYSDHTPL